MSTSVRDLERFCLEKDKLKVVVRAGRDEIIPGFGRINAINKNKTISQYGEYLKEALGGRDFDIVDGSGNYPHGNSKISTVRESYS